jgi:hypothetical protein
MLSSVKSFTVEHAAQRKPGWRKDFAANRKWVERIFREPLA